MIFCSVKGGRIFIVTFQIIASCSEHVCELDFTIASRAILIHGGIGHILFHAGAVSIETTIASAAKFAYDHVVILEVLGAEDTLLLFVEEQSVARPLLLLVESVSSGLSTVVADNWLMDRCLVVFGYVVPGEVKE